MMSEHYDSYYQETDAGRRKAMLDAMEKENTADQMHSLRRELWTLRYVDKKTGRRVDLFLWELVELLCLYNTARLMKGSARRDAKKALEALGASAAAGYGKEGETVLYEELCNALRLYLHTCDSKSYHKRLFGLSELKEEDWQRKVARDIWRLSEGLPKRLGMTEDFAILSKAARDTFCSRFANGEALLQEKEELERGKDKKQ